MSRQRTFEDFLELFGRKGVLLCSLTQMSKDCWRCSLRPRNKAVTAYGQGDTACECLGDAWSRYKSQDAWDGFVPISKPKRVRKRIKFKE